MSCADSSCVGFIALHGLEREREGVVMNNETLFWCFRGNMSFFLYDVYPVLELVFRAFSTYLSVRWLVFEHVSFDGNLHVLLGMKYMNSLRNSKWSSRLFEQFIIGGVCL